MKIATRSADPEKIKALAFDLDGTLLAPGAVLTERTRKVLRGCMDRGVRIIIATGRSVASADRYRREIDAQGPMICFNGAKVVVMPGGEILGFRPLDPQTVGFCVDLARKMDVYYQVYFARSREQYGELLMGEKDRAEAWGYRDHTGICPVFGDLKAALGAADFEGCIKSMFLAEPEVLDRIRPRLEERFGDRVYITKSSPAFLEVLAAGVTKGSGLRIAMDRYGFSPEEVIAFGDEENDLPMFTVAGFAVVPANAASAIRASADFVTGANTEDGAAAFLTGFFGL
ncbi:MAG: Cof-type HAD-IIB family hydrolase [Treponema sp.]|jgi:Cof subfamily protein (haloacid dehalogenase superfamily)|nr:Cof-type HAD-IIB family hydrolase [Treponema sp.]